MNIEMLVNTVKPEFSDLYKKIHVISVDVFLTHYKSLQHNVKLHYSEICINCLKTKGTMKKIYVSHGLRAYNILSNLKG